MKNESISPRHVKDVLKSKNLDVTPVEQFLTHSNALIRKAAIEIVVHHGDKKKIIPFIEGEKDRGVLLFAMTLVITKCKDLSGSIDSLAKFVNWYDSAIQEKAIEMCYRLKRTDLLTDLLFDETQLERIKRYIEEEENGKNS